MDLLFRWSLNPSTSLLTAQVGVRNTSNQPIRIKSLTPLAASFVLNTRLADWWLTGLHPKTPLQRPCMDLPAAMRIHESGMFYRNPHSGLVFGPVGEPITWLDHFWQQESDHSLSLRSTGSMDLVFVHPNQTRWGQAIGLVFDQTHTALDAWTSEVAKSHQARVHHTALTGWNNWNYLKKK